jgi:hypothetical protein
LKKQTGLIDACGRKAKVFLENLAKKVRQPYTDYEAETAAMQAEIEHKAMIATAHDAALIDDEIRTRCDELDRKEASIREQEEERQHIEQARLDAEVEAERQKAIRAEAEAKAKREAEEQIQVERERAEKAELDKKNAVEIARRNAVEAEAKAKADKATAIETERLRMIREQAEKDAAAKAVAYLAEQAETARQANADHRRQVNQGALKALIDNGFDKAAAKQIITLIFQNKIPGIRMMY